MKKVMNIEGMRCPHCSSNVEKALCAVEGVKSAVVDLAARPPRWKLKTAWPTPLLKPPWTTLALK